MNDGIVGTDWDVEPCRYCHSWPRIHLHRFSVTTKNAMGKRLVLNRTKVYYDCQCQSCVTRWVESEYDENNPRVIKKSARDIVKEMWNRGEFL